MLTNEKYNRRKTKYLKFNKESDQIDGLTFAIIVVFEFPPKESCINMSFNISYQGKKYTQLDRIVFSFRAFSIEPEVEM